MDTREDTTSGLQNKPWYRFLKVIYLLGFLTSLITVITISAQHFSDKVINNTKTSITCNLGNKQIFTASEEKFNFVYSETGPNHIALTHDDAVKLYNLCQIPIPEGLVSALEAMEIQGFEIKPDIQIRSQTVSYWAYFLLGIIVTGLIFELIKKLFFYIILGRTRFKK